MKFLFDVFPVLLFFVSFKFFGIYVATAVAIGATLLQVVFSWASRRKVEVITWLNLGVIGLFGGLTLILQNEIFIKWKPTILYALFALILLVADKFYNRNLLKLLIRSTIELPERIWLKMNYSWVVFFGALAGLNLIVAYSVSTDAWVNFKLFGLIGLTVLFVVGQSVWLSRHALAEKS